MNRIIALITLILVAVTASARRYNVDEIPNYQLSDASRLVSNPDGILSRMTEDELNETLCAIRDSTTAEITVVVVNDITEDSDIDTFATDLFEKWGIGKSQNDNGVLLLVVKDMRHAVIRTGYGMEGALPDVIAARILRESMFPAFKEGDYDGGVVAAVNDIERVVTDPQYADEIRAAGEQEGLDDFYTFIISYITLAVIITLILLVVLLIKIISVRKLDPVEQYTKLESMKALYLALAAFGLGVPLIAFFFLKRQLKAVRNTRRPCPNCSTLMDKLDEDADNFYLTPSQDAEERYDSVDYDVWLCPNCREIEIIPFVNKEKNLCECSKCHARTSRLMGDVVSVQPTTSTPGRGLRTYKCLNCQNVETKPYVLPKLAVPVVGGVGGGGGGRSFGGGGGFGGGHTGGGGASGGW